MNEALHLVAMVTMVSLAAIAPSGEELQSRTVLQYSTVLCVLTHFELYNFIDMWLRQEVADSL